MIAVVANGKELPVYHLDMSQALMEVPLMEEIFVRLYSGYGEPPRRVVRLLKRHSGR